MQSHVIDWPTHDHGALTPWVGQWRDGGWRAALSHWVWTLRQPQRIGLWLTTLWILISVYRLFLSCNWANIISSLYISSNRARQKLWVVNLSWYCDVPSFLHQIFPCGLAVSLQSQVRRVRQSWAHLGPVCSSTYKHLHWWQFWSSSNPTRLPFCSSMAQTWSFSFWFFHPRTTHSSTHAYTTNTHTFIFICSLKYKS